MQKEIERRLEKGRQGEGKKGKEEEGREGEREKRDGKKEEGRNLCKAGRKRSCLQKSGALHHASAK